MAARLWMAIRVAWYVLWDVPGDAEVHSAAMVVVWTRDGESLEATKALDAWSLGGAGALGQTLGVMAMEADVAVALSEPREAP